MDLALFFSARKPGEVKKIPDLVPITRLIEKELTENRKNHLEVALMAAEYTKQSSFEPTEYLPGNVEKLVELLNQGTKPIIEWLPCKIPITQQDCYDIGMFCRVKAYSIDFYHYYKDGEVKVYEFLTDFSEFEEYNKTIEVSDWYDIVNGDLVLPWSKSAFYPKDKQVYVYLQTSTSEQQRDSGDMFRFLYTGDCKNA